MPPLPADIRPFIARPRAVEPSPVESTAPLRPFIAGPGARAAGPMERQPALESSGVEQGTGDSAASLEELPWLSEAASALAGAEPYPEELLAVTPLVPALQEEEDGSAVEPWDDELGTFALSEELPELEADAEDSGFPYSG